MTRVAASIVLGLLMTASAGAQTIFDPIYGPQPYRGVYRNPYVAGYPYPGRPFGAPASTCQKLCIQDTTPCDPPEFKRADGRCQDPTRPF